MRNAGRLVWGVAVLLGLSGIYLFFAGTVDLVELIAMAVCATSGTALAVALEVVAKRNFAPMPPPKAVLRPFLALLPEFLVVGRELVAAVVGGSPRMRGDFVRQPFVAGGDTPRERARRALSIIGISLAPRTFAVRGELTGELLLHGLPSKPASSDASWPA